MEAPPLRRRNLVAADVQLNHALKRNAALEKRVASMHRLLDDLGDEIRMLRTGDMSLREREKFQASIVKALEGTTLETAATPGAVMLDDGPKPVEAETDSLREALWLARSPMPMTDGHYSRFILRVERFLTSLGVSVSYRKPKTVTDPRVIACIDYEAKSVWLKEPTARRALMVLAREAGHWVHHVRNQGRGSRADYERSAYFFGWALLQALNCGLISKAEWRALFVVSEHWAWIEGSA